MTRRRRIVWFADLEGLIDDLSVLERLRGEIGLTTVAPESHLSHTSGFAVSPGIAAASPLVDWRSRPGLRDHREVFGVPEPAMAVLPGIVGGVDHRPLLRVLDECRRLGIEVWGHAGVWCYGAEVFPEFAAVDLWGQPLLPGSLPWGTMFCPSKAGLNAWIAGSLADAAARYDLDGWFLDHARYPSPGHVASLFACACSGCESAAASRGVSLDGIRAIGRDALLADAARPDGGGIDDWLARQPLLRQWFEVRAEILADRFGGLRDAVAAASPRPVEFGSDVFPPSVALVGGQAYDRWAAAGATYLTGGFGPKIGWGTVERLTRDSLGAAPDDAAADEVADELDAFSTELRRMATARGDLPVYPPIAGPPDPAILARVCDAIVDAGLEGAMVAGLEATTVEQRAVLREHLTGRLL